LKYYSLPFKNADRKERKDLNVRLVYKYYSLPFKNADRKEKKKQSARSPNNGKAQY